jgi:hypothetical protein
MSFASDGQRVVISDVVRASLNASFSSSSQDFFGGCGRNDPVMHEAPTIRINQRSGSNSNTSSSSSSSLCPLEDPVTNQQSSSTTSTPRRGPVNPMSTEHSQQKQQQQQQKRDALSFPFSAPIGEWGHDSRRETRPPRPPMKSTTVASSSTVSTPKATPSRLRRIRDERQEVLDSKEGNENEKDEDPVLSKDEIAFNTATENRLRDSLTALNIAAENVDSFTKISGSLNLLSCGDMNARAIEYTNTGRWCCTVCFFATNKPYSRVCSMCDSDNPFASVGGLQNARDESNVRVKKNEISTGTTSKSSVVIVWVCPACAFDSPAGTTECLVCSLPLHPPSDSPNEDVKQQVFNNGSSNHSHPISTLKQLQDNSSILSDKPIISIVSPVAAGGSVIGGGGGVFLPSPSPTPIQMNQPISSIGPVESVYTAAAGLNSSTLSMGSASNNTSALLSLQGKSKFLSDPWTSRRQRPSIVTVNEERLNQNQNQSIDNFVSILNASMYTTTKETTLTSGLPITQESFPLDATTVKQVNAVAVQQTGSQPSTPLLSINSPASLPPRPHTPLSKTSVMGPSDVDKKLLELEQRTRTLTAEKKVLEQNINSQGEGSSTRERLSVAKSDLARSRIKY